MIDTSEILVLQEIQAGFTESVINQLSSLNGPAHVRINSPGGNVAEALGALNALQSHPQGCKVTIEGVALSAAAILACAGECTAYDNSIVMLHAPAMVASGNALDLMRAIEALTRHASSMQLVLTNKTRQPAAVVQSWLSSDGDTWFSAEEARRAGLVNTIVRNTVSNVRNFGRFTPPLALTGELRARYRKPTDDEVAAAQRLLMRQVSGRLN